jgi:hypothetical protein
LALELCKLGATNRDLGLALHAHEKTICDWLAKYPKFAKAVHEGRAIADAKVASSLYHRAIGYSHKAIKMFCHEGFVITKDYTERFPPDTTACIFWLKNRRPDLWRDRQQHEHSGPDGKAIEVDTKTWDMAAVVAELKKRNALPEGLLERLSKKFPGPSTPPSTAE